MEDKVPYTLRPLSLTVEEIDDMAIIHDGIEMRGQVDVRIPREKAIQLLEMLKTKIAIGENQKVILFTLRGMIK